MSTTIDQRVVEMRFDNKHFERNVSTTMSTLDKLKKSLNLDGAAKGLDDVSAAAKKCDVSAVGAAAEKVGLKFSAMYTMADQALRNITNSAMNAGKRIVSALTIDPIKTGFQEYETQINAIQTILANTQSKGTTLEDVNSALDELNAYADKTIYNFTEMTRNIGTFTAAGTDLDTSVKAIQGIANLAAVSGSTSQQASTAMYQLSQAMASGTVKLMDWNSVVNAGMGGQVFQDALKETAKVHGVAIDEIISKNGSFRESLSEGWLTTEILTDTLEKFTMYAEEGSEEWEKYKKTLMDKGYSAQQAEEILNMGKTATEAATKVKTFTQLFDTLKEAAQSGWTQTWEILVGDFEEAKELLTKISDVVGGFINQMSESRNELLENWKVMGGRDDLIQSFANIWEGLLSIIKPIKEAFSEIFPPATAEQLFKLTENLKNFTAKLKLSDKGAENLKRTFKGVFAVFKLAGTIIGAVVGAIGKLFTGVGHLGGGLLDVTAVIGDFLVYFVELITYGDLFEKVFTGLSAVINFVAKAFSLLIKGLAAVFDFLGNGVAFPGITFIVEGLAAITKSFTGAEDAAVSFKDRIAAAFATAGEVLMNNPIFKAITKMWEGVKSLIKIVGNFFGKMFGSLFNQLSNGDFSGFFEIVHGLISGGFGIALINFIKSLKDLIGGANDIAGSIDDLLGSISGSFKAFQNSLNAEALKDLAIAIAILAAAVLVLSFINHEKLMDAVSVITMLFFNMMGAMSVMAKMNGIPETFAMATAMIALSAAIVILASAMKSVSSLNYDEIGRGLVGVAGLLLAFVGAMKLMSLGKSASTAGVLQLIAVALATKILASILLDIAKLDWEELAIGIIGMTATMAVLVGAMKILPLGSKNIAKPFFKFMGQMWVVVRSVRKLADVLLDFAYLEWNEMAVGLVGLTGTMALLVGAMKILPLATKDLNVGAVVSLTFAMLALATSMRILTPALETFGDMNWGELAKAGVALAVLLGLFELFALSIKMVQPSTILATAGSLLMMSTAMLVLSGALSIFASMSWEKLAKAGAALGVFVGAIALLGLISKFADPVVLLAMAASMVIFASALTGLIVPLTVFAAFNWEMLAKAGVVIGGLVGAIALLGLIADFANPLTMIAIGASLIVVASGLTAMIVPLTAIGLMSWSTIAKGLVLIAGALSVLGVAAIVFKTMRLDITIMSVSASLLLFGAALTLIGVGLGLVGAGLAAFAGGFAALSASATVFVWNFLEIAALLVEKTVEMFGRWIVSTCKVIIEAAPAIAQAVIAVVLAIIDVLQEALVPLTDAILLLVQDLISQLIKYAPGIASGLFELLVVVLESLRDYIPPLIDVLLDICILVVEGLGSRMAELTARVVELLAEFFEGIGQALQHINPMPLIMGVAVVAGLMSLVKELGKINIKDVGNAAKGMVYIGLLVVELAAMLALIGGFMEACGGVKYLNIAGDAMGAISIALLKSIPMFAAMALVIAVAPAINAGFSAAMQALGYVAVLALELVAIIGIFGAVASIPGGIELINKAGDLFEAVGVAIGRLIGGIVGGIAKGFTSTLPGIAEDMSGFITNLKPFLDEAAKVDSSVLAGVGYLCGAVLLFTASSVIAGLTTLLTGGLGLGSFLLSVATIGLAIKMFSDSVQGVDIAGISSAASAANGISLAVLAMTGTSILTALTSVLTAGFSFVSYLASVETVGEAIRIFSEKVQGVDPTTITAAASAAGPLSKAVLSMTGTSLLNGLATILTCGLNLATYLGSVSTIGESIKVFSDKVKGTDPAVITAAASAAGSLVDAVLVFTGASFLAGLVALVGCGINFLGYIGAVSTIGESVKIFSDKVKGVDPGVITAAASAADSLTGTVVKMTGASFLAGLVAFMGCGVGFAAYLGSVSIIGESMKVFSDKVKGIDPAVITAAASAADTLSGTVLIMTAAGFLSGLAAILTCGLSLAAYVGSVSTIGESMKMFSDKVKGVDPTTIEAAASAANTLAGTVLIMTGAGFLSGLAAILTGGLSIATYKGSIKVIGESVKAFSEEVDGVKPDVISAAASAANDLAATVAIMSGSSLINALKDILTLGFGNLGFENAVKSIGKAVVGFYKEVKDINPDKTSAAASAAKDLADTVAVLPKDSKNLTSFGDNLEKFGTKLVSYFGKVAGVSEESTKASTNALGAVKEITTVDSAKIKEVSSSVDNVTKSVKDLSAVPGGMISKFTKDLKALGESGVDAFVKEFEKMDDDMKDAGEDAITAFKNGADSKLSKATKAFKDIADECAEALSDKVNAFEKAGKALVQGFADGISANSYKAEAKAKAMAEAAEKAAKEALKINSPSKVFMEIGGGVPEGFAMGVDKLGNLVKKSTESMTDNSIDGVRRGISRIADIVNSDMDAQPTIRPVLDLSDVRNGASAISGMFNSNPSIGVLSNVGAISSMMDAKNQNGANDDVVSAIEDLNKNLENVGNTYNFGNITAGDDEAIAEAVQLLIRAAIRERRV